MYRLKCNDLSKNIKPQNSFLLTKAITKYISTEVINLNVRQIFYFHNLLL